MHKQPRLTKKKFSFTLGILALVMAAPLLMGNLTSLPLVTNQAQAAKIIKRVKVGPTDTLWSLARQHRENTDLTIQQAMLAIKDANPKAFPSNNINEMEPTATLAIPSALAMSKRTALEADRQVRRENQLWAAHKNKPNRARLVNPQAGKQPAATNQPATKPAAKPAPKAATKPEPKVAATSPTASKQLEEAAKPSLEANQNLTADLDKATRFLNEATQDLDKATSKIAELEVVLALKDRQLDEMEEQLKLAGQPSLQASPEPQKLQEPNKLDPSLTARMNREPWLYGGYAAAIFFSLMFFLAWLLARGKVKQLEKKNAKIKSAPQEEPNLALAALEIENLEQLDELSKNDELALKATLEKELSLAEASPALAAKPDVALAEKLEEKPEVNLEAQPEEGFQKNLEENLEEKPQKEEPQKEELELALDEDLTSNDLSLDLEELSLDELELEPLELDELPPELEIANLEAASTSALDELVKTDLGTEEANDFGKAEDPNDFGNLEALDELETLDDLEALDDLEPLDDLEELLPSLEADEPLASLAEADLNELEAPLAQDELSENTLAVTDFEQVKYESDADEFLDALDSLDSELDNQLDQLEADLEELATSSEAVAEDLEVTATSESLEEVKNLEDLINQNEEDQDQAHEVDTLADNHISQLDLAAAYIEMDDQAGAKEILNELIKQAAPEIQIKAQQLLETLT